MPTNDLGRVCVEGLAAAMWWVPGDRAVGDDPGDGVEGLGEQFPAGGESLQLTPPFQFGDGVFDRDTL
jgi:hypothetical protein